ncbi:MAG: SusC/RagA family TonB-linked outer membrane protein, partial [Alistipes onderdonkii]|nr:SusC/RagA family TonB-linked outer membrane protein [Alistipes onderdonkii]
MKKISIILLFLAAVCPLAQAQRVKVYVTDAWDKPLGEVAVTLGRGRIPVAVTGADGMAEVDAGEGDRMTLTLLNRMSRTVAVSGGEMHIRLTDDDVLFDVGYDERVRKGSASASLAGAAAREIEAGGRTDLMSNLYGLIPGLGVRQGENLPWDSAPDLNVRGVGSFGGNSVVVLVDGIERDAACLDREEVERITVLKDAASLALYGNRGADGIVAVTTRRGGDHGLRTRIDYNFSVQTPFRVPDMADAATYATAVNEALENDGLAPRYTQRDIRSMVRGERTDVLPNVDWRKAVLRNAGFNHDLNLSFDGSGGRMRYFVLANYNSNRGMLDNTDLNDGYSTQIEMYSLKLRSNLEAAITKTTTARMNLMGRLMQYQLPNAGVALDDMYDTPSAAFPIRVPGGGWARSQLFANPLADKAAGGYNTLLQRTLFADLT